MGESSGAFFNDRGDGSPFHLADADGVQASLTWQRAGAPKRATGSFTFTGGTGKYQDIRGTSPFTGVTQINWADGTASGYAIWNR
jgi:hypothetical protein